MNFHVQIPNGRIIQGGMIVYTGICGYALLEDVCIFIRERNKCIFRCFQISSSKNKKEMSGQPLQTANFALAYVVFGKVVFS